jgi:hypothetical protein
MKDPHQDMVYVHIKPLLEMLPLAIPSTGGAFTVKAIARRLEVAGAKLDALTPQAKLALVRRLLEISAFVRGKGEVKFPAFIEINTQTGRIVRPRRPRGVEPVGEELLFAPRSE